MGSLISLKKKRIIGPVENRNVISKKWNVLTRVCCGPDRVSPRGAGVSNCGWKHGGRFWKLSMHISFSGILVKPHPVWQQWAVASSLLANASKIRYVCSITFQRLLRFKQKMASGIQKTTEEMLLLLKNTEEPVHPRGKNPPQRSYTKMCAATLGTPSTGEATSSRWKQKPYIVLVISLVLSHPL